MIIIAGKTLITIDNAPQVSTLGLMDGLDSEVDRGEKMPNNFYSFSSWLILSTG